MLKNRYVWGGVAGFILLLAALVAGAYWYVLGVPGRPYAGPPPALTPEEIALATELRRHVTAVASAPHNVRHCEELEKAALYIESRLRDFGFSPERQEFEVDGCDVRNIAVAIPASEKTGGATLVIGAHYDSDGIAPGANDNATGTAAVLELARLLKDLRPRRTTPRFVFFVNEERPYFRTPDMGSLRYADMLKARNEKVLGMMSLETLGYFSDAPGSQKYPEPFGHIFPPIANFVAFVGLPGSRDFLHDVLRSFRSHTRFPTIGGIAPDAISGIGLSDHWAFSRVGYPAIMITDTAFFRYPHYHRATDTPDKVDYDSLARITMGLTRVVREIADRE